MKKNNKNALDNTLIEAYKKGEFLPAKNQKNAINIAIAAANAYLKKDARINIRISEADLMGLKVRAAEEGLPYQTLVASILHKFVSGRLVSENA